MHCDAALTGAAEIIDITIIENDAKNMCKNFIDTYANTHLIKKQYPAYNIEPQTKFSRGEYSKGVNLSLL